MDIIGIARGEAVGRAREALAAAFERSGLSGTEVVTQLSEKLGVSTRTAYRILRRARAGAQLEGGQAWPRRN